MPKKRQRANGDGDIFPRRDKSGKIISYRGPYYVETPEGRKRRFVSGKTPKETREKLAEAKRAAKGGIAIADETLADYLRFWLAGTAKTKGLKAVTIENYARQLNRHVIPEIGGIKLAKLQASHIQDLLDARTAAGAKPGSVRQLHITLSGALEDAYKRGKILENPARRKVSPPKARKGKVHPLSAEQVHRLLEAASGDRYEALLVLAVHAGLRIGELLALKWQDINFDAKTLTVGGTLSRAKGGEKITDPKTGSGRSIKLTPTAVDSLRKHRARQNEERLMSGDLWNDEGYVFPNQSGGLTNYDWFYRQRFKAILRRAGLSEKIRLHDLRHTCATLLLSQRVPAKYVQELLGHASITVTMNTYSHWMPQMGDHTADAMEAALA